MTSAAIAISYKTRRMLMEGCDGLPPGAAHYSYKNVRDKFIECFAEFGVPYFELDRPEIYPRWRGAPAPLCHLQFKPFEEIRILKGVPNVAHVAWEFERLPTSGDWAVGDARRLSPMNDYRHMLSLADEVWVGSHFAQSVIAEAGVASVHVIPAPIRVRRGAATRNVREAQGAACDPVVAGAASRLTHIRTWAFNRHNLRSFASPDVARQELSLTEVLLTHRHIFLLIANAGDIRKNLPAAMLAMRRIGADAKACLIIKLVTEDTPASAAHAITVDLTRRFEELELERDDFLIPNVFVVTSYLSEAALEALYGSVHFYLCAAFAEGQNLPLLEAMAHGVIPVSVANTAMADYLDDSNSFPIETRSAPAPKCFERAYGLAGLQLKFSAEADVAAAIARAIGCDREMRLALSRAAKARIERDYSNAAVAERIASRLFALEAQTRDGPR
jgi:glycosyltransferase involved in cell wall biosynthesis